jgi:hypothetical protein
MRLLALLVVVAPLAAWAGNALIPGTVTVDRPTLTAVGVQWLITGDDNRNATGTLRYRVVGTQAWHAGPPLHRVHPENVTALTVPEQLSASVFDLRPATAYELELTAVDSDGGGATITLTSTTRAVPADPLSPRARSVTNAATLTAALSSAQAGDVITLADGMYSGAFALNASGTAGNPIVLRGTSREGTVLDGNACSCNVLEVYGSFVHLENLTIRNATRAVRFQGTGTEGNVVRRVHITDVTLGIGSKPDQLDFYLCDNLLEGRLTWPSVYADDSGAHANDDGIHVEGRGHVVCHNDLIGFGDAMKTEQVDARSVDFIGNEVRSCYDNAIELDTSSGNTRALRNRITNCYAPLSFQPIYGGPVYAVRNVVINSVNEQMKFHSLGGTDETSGIEAWHNTFVSSRLALNLQDGTTAHHFKVQNNLFVGPATLVGTRAVDWTGGIDDGVFDYDGIFPDGRMSWNFGTYTTHANFAAAQAAGVESHGRLLTTPLFASGLLGPADYHPALAPQDVTLAVGSNALDTGLVIPGVNDGFLGAGPDLGALEQGCPLPVYGIRAAGIDESNEPVGCEAPALDGGTGGGGGATGGGGGSTGGGGGSAGGGGSTGGGGGGEVSDAGGGSGGGNSVAGSCGCSSGAQVTWLLAAGLIALRRSRRGSLP